MTPLEVEIRSRIALDGPMPIAEYVTVCLTHPQHGYYTTNHPVGGRASAHREGGDFITAPEVSQLFGEMICIWCMEVWQALGSPKSFNLVELGPGRGTLMRDLLRVAPALPGFLPAAQIHLVEISPTLAEQQSLLLSESAPSIKWIQNVSDLPPVPSIIIANEFLDALPFRQWVKHENNWYERAVGLIDDQLQFVLKPTKLPEDALPSSHATEPDGMIFETAPAREAHIESIAHQLKQTDGAALFIDYGHLEAGFGDTFQAVRNHAYVDALAEPGLADLTSHVDFSALLAAAIKTGCTAPAPVSQSDFLVNLGLLERAGILGRDKPEAIQGALQQAVNRLAGPDQMGNLFKVMAFGSPASLGERWAGFL